MHAKVFEVIITPVQKQGTRDVQNSRSNNPTTNTLILQILPTPQQYTLHTTINKRCNESTWIHRIIEIPPFVHPNFGNPRGVFVHNFCHATGKTVRGLVSKNMTHVRTRNYLENSTTLPHLARTTETKRAHKQKQCGNRRIQHNRGRKISSSKLRVVSTYPE